MDVVFERCAGIAVQKRTVVVCRLTPDAEGQLVAPTHTCGTTTGDVLHLCDWLADGGCPHVPRSASKARARTGSRSITCSKARSRSGC